MEKMCSICLSPKPLPDGFHRRGRGFASECKDCRSKRDKGIYWSNVSENRRRKAWVNPNAVSGNKSPVCKECGRGIEEVPFGTRKSGERRYYRHACKDCHNKETKLRHSPEALKIRGNRYQKHLSAQRKNLQNVEIWIYRDSRGSDRKRGFGDSFDLTKDFIRDLIADGCKYCGAIDIRIGLDRIDNNRGHSKDNVIPCCIRCNYIRRHMPYEAWIAIVPAIKMARETGLFGAWLGKCR